MNDDPDGFVVKPSYEQQLSGSGVGNAAAATATAAVPYANSAPQMSQHGVLANTGYSPGGAYAGNGAMYAGQTGAESGAPYPAYSHDGTGVAAAAGGAALAAGGVAAGAFAARGSPSHPGSRAHLQIPQPLGYRGPSSPVRNAMGSAYSSHGLGAAASSQPRLQQIVEDERRATAGPSLSRNSSVRSIEEEQLGRGAGYASPMPPMGPDGKPLDQKTWRERQKMISGGVSPDTVLTAEQRARRDSQLPTLQSTHAIARSRSSAPTSPIAGQSQQSEMMQHTTSASTTASASLPYLRDSSYNSQPGRQTGYNYHPQAQPYNQYPSQPGPSRPPQTLQDIVPDMPPPRSSSNPQMASPSLPPKPDSTALSRPSNVGQNQQDPSQLQMQPQQHYELYQPPRQETRAEPIRASFASPPPQPAPISPPLASHVGTFAQAQSAQSVPRPSGASMEGDTARSPPLSPRMSGSYPAFDAATRYDLPAGAAGMQRSPSSSIHGLPDLPGTSSLNSHATTLPRYTSVTDDLFDGLTSGLSSRDVARLSHMSRHPQPPSTASQGRRRSSGGRP